MFELPTTVTVSNKTFPIRNNGDFRMVLDCFNALNDVELDASYRIITSLIIFYEGLNSIEDVLNTFENNLQEAVTSMFNFFNCGQPNSPGAPTKQILVDWDKDQQLIASAVNTVANKEIRLESYIHWWTFMGYYLAIGESPFSTVVSIRNKIKKGKKLETYEKEFKRENPDYFVWNSNGISNTEVEESIKNLWNNGG